MKLPIMYTTFEERQKITDLFDADYYGFSVGRWNNSMIVTAYENDKKTVKGTMTINASFQFGLPSYNQLFLPREAFLLGVSVCMVDGEPAYFIGVDDQHYAPDDRQYFAVIPMNDDDEGCIKRVNDIDNFITLLAPVMDAQALYQPTEEDDIDTLPAD